MDKDAVKEVFLPNREDCFKFLRKKRWDEKGGVRCLYCLSQNIHHNGYTTKGARKYKCCECGKYFNDLTGTIFENRRFFIEEMFYIIKEMETKSALQISEELGRDYDSVLNFIHKVHRLSCEHSKKITLEGVIEVDEVYVHAGEKGKKKGNGIGRRRGLRKRGRGTWEKDKPPVLTIVKRGSSQKLDSA
jgi:transposase-like protein